MLLATIARTEGPLVVLVSLGRDGVLLELEQRSTGPTVHWELRQLLAGPATESAAGLGSLVAVALLGRDRVLWNLTRRSAVPTVLWELEQLSADPTTESAAGPVSRRARFVCWGTSFVELSLLFSF